MYAFGTRSAILVFLALALSSPLLVPIGADSKDSFSRLEVISNTHKVIKLEGYDQVGDMLHITIAPVAIEGRQSRPIDVYLMEDGTASRFDMIRMLDPDTQAMYFAHNVSSRFEKDYKCLTDTKVSLVLYNAWREGDDTNISAATAIYRVDYSVTDVESKDNTPWILLVFALIALLIAGAVIAGIVIYRRSKRDRSSFFVKGSFLYYALQGPDGNVFYFGPDQYDRMYSSGALAGFQFLGYTREIGGEIYNESGAPMAAASVAPAAAYPTETVQQPVASPPIVLQAPAPVVSQLSDVPSSEVPTQVPDPDRTADLLSTPSEATAGSGIVPSQ